MRVIFMGSPDFAVPTLNALVAAGHELVAAYTQPPRASGRGKAERPTVVEARARKLGIEVRSPASLRGSDEQAEFAALGADVAVVAAYGLILPPPILDAPALGCLNVHGSLLPRWRGAAPVQRAIMAGDRISGVTIMAMEAGLDTGPMLLKREVTIGDKDSAQLTEELAELGAAMMVEVLADLPAFPPEPQPAEGITYAAKIAKAEAKIDWGRSATEIARQVQGLAPFPGAWFEHQGERIKILRATAMDGAGRQPGEVLDDGLAVTCGSGLLRPLLVQRAGRAAMSPGELVRGFAIPPGTMLE